MDINAIAPNIEDTYFNPGFLVLLESHLTYLRTSATLQSTAVSGLQKSKFEGDFYGLLTDLGIDYRFHYIVLRVNGYDSSADYRGESDAIVVPALSDIDMLKNIFLTTS